MEKYRMIAVSVQMSISIRVDKDTGFCQMTDSGNPVDSRIDVSTMAVPADLADQPMIDMNEMFPGISNELVRITRELLILIREPLAAA
ncbi:hypothetical protein ABO04_04390 [Nitrosomonas sp. HPC101]|nr:hypothetical protein [Nitrosomonas sp. HPC101]